MRVGRKRPGTRSPRSSCVSTVHQARLEIIQWLTCYNTRRRHSALNYLSPAEFEQQHLRADIRAIAA
ncbi:integrase core domain-containing protein [Streptomyces sp. x-19]|uniref:integrase core domain-containing protein n=1 Tax=Streptomyces sp. x-19 TaxID=2789280 RepID=UPI0039807911